MNKEKIENLVYKYGDCLNTMSLNSMDVDENRILIDVVNELEGKDLINFTEELERMGYHLESLTPCEGDPPYFQILYEKDRMSGFCEICKSEKPNVKGILDYMY